MFRQMSAKVTVFLVWAIVAGMPQKAQSSTYIEGSLECKIKYLTLIKTAEAVTETFSGYKDQIQQGDQISVLYYVEEDAGNNEIRIGLKTKDTYGDKYKWRSIDRIKSLHRDPKNNFYLISLTNEVVYLDEDYIDFSDESGALKLKRYYKNDFEGLVVDSAPGIVNAIANLNLSASVYTLDCRHTNDRLQDIQVFLASKFQVSTHDEGAQ